MKQKLKEEVFQYLDEFIDCLGSIKTTHIRAMDVRKGEIPLVEEIKLVQAVEKTVRFLRSVKKREKSLFFVGNGGSAAIAGHQATDFIKTCKIRAFAPFDYTLLTCMANDCGFDSIFSEPLKLMAKSGDILIAISSSGQSKDILNAVSVFIQKKCRVITLSGFKPDNPLRFLGDINFYVPSDSYRFVESAHQIICDLLLDFTIRSLEEKEN